ncbi:MAG: hypothetical protein IPN89_06540 [Saprospiraceae bacterium]|nr:hypothetical protein [Saprospiraceae bacterium]
MSEIYRVCGGSYPVAIIQHPKFGECLQINGVKDRSGILVHVANDALKELRGCIAPVFARGGMERSAFDAGAWVYHRESEDKWRFESFYKDLFNKTEAVKSE